MHELRNIRPDVISKNPRNRRIARDAKTYASLVASMRAKGFDEAHPLRVRRTTSPDSPSEAFELVGGETRYDAGCEVGIKEFPCVVEELSELEALIELGADNEQTPFTAIEKAMLLRDIEAAGGVVANVLPRLGLADTEASRAKRALLVFDHAVAEGCAGASLSDKDSFLYEVSRAPKARWTELSKLVEKNKISRAALREIAAPSKRAAGKKAAPEPVRAVTGNNPVTAVKAVIAPAYDVHQETKVVAEIVEQTDSGCLGAAAVDAPAPGSPQSSREVLTLVTSPSLVSEALAPSVSAAPALSPSEGWLALDALAEVYEFPCAPPGWGCAIREGKPVFGPLKAPQEPWATPHAEETPGADTLPTAPVIALQGKLLAGLIRVELTDALFEAIERAAPDVQRNEVAAFQAPAGVVDGFDLAFGEGAPWFRKKSVLPHQEQRKALAALKVLLVPPSEICHDEQRRHLASQPGAVLYGHISSATSHQHVTHVASVTFEDDGSGPEPLALTVIGGHVVQLPEARLHSKGGGLPSRLFAVVKRRV